MLELVPIVSSALIAFSIGSNDTSNAFGISVGCGALTFKKATFLLLFFVLIGAILQGQKVMKTVGKDLVELNLYPLSLALLFSAVLIAISNLKGFPVSTHQVIIGSLIGSGFAFGLRVNSEILLKIILSWIISPFTSFFLSIILYMIIEKITARFSLIRIERILKALLLISGMLIAYNTGANELATAFGPVVHYGLLDQFQASLTGSILIWFGAITLSHRVIETIGKGITALDPYSGFSAQFGAGLSVWIFTSLGLPISTTYCIIGGISGVGTFKGMRTVKIGLVKRIVLNWILIPVSAFLISYSISRITAFY